MIKIYLASRYSRFQEMQNYRASLRSWGYEVTSRWINGDHQSSEAAILATDRASQEERVRFATEDLADLQAADWVISFTEEPRATNSRGGRHVEFGIALAARKRCIVIGPRENVFHCLPQVRWFPTWEAFASSGMMD